MIAFLGMYDMPETREANDRFWTAIRARLGYGPRELTRDRDVWELWMSPDLVLAQTCGLPFRARLAGHVTLVGTPNYALPECPPGFYRSVFVTQANQPSPTLSGMNGATFAYNEGLSQSGWAAPMTCLTTRGVTIGRRLETGAHVASAHAVANGRADFAALDALTWELIRTHNPDLAACLQVLDVTDPGPGLPFITARTRDPAPIASAVACAIDDLSAADRATLHLHGLEEIPESTYLAVPTPPLP